MSDENSDVFVIPDNPYELSDSTQSQDMSIDISDKEGPPAADVNSDQVREISDEGDESKFKLIPFLCDNKLMLISSSITLLFIIISSIVAGTTKDKHIVTRTLEIVDMRGCFFIWALHSAGLVVLPWFFTFLFGEEIHVTFLFFSPIMMFLNMLGGFVSIKGACYPLLIELIITIFLLFYLPFDNIYLFKTKKFFLGELTLMTLTFVYISSALGASTLSYTLFARYIRINKQLILYPKNPYYAIKYFKLAKNVNGIYLACYSLFTFFSVGIGFLMSFRNSILMTIPFLMLAICTVIETHGIGILLFCQLAFHVAYLISLYKSKTKKIVAGCCDCCFTSCNASLTTIMIGDLIGFLLIVFPVFGILLDGYREKWNWGYFIGGSLFMMVGAIAHFYLSFDPDVIFAIVCAPAFFTVGVYLFGFGFKGYFPFIRAYTFEITYLSWSFSLCFWAWCNGFSPVLFKFYNALVPACALIIIDVYEGFGWIELIFALVQIFFDTCMIVIVQLYPSKYIAWAVFSVSGIAVMGLLAGVAIVVVALIALAVVAICCCAAGGGAKSVEEQAADYVRDHNLKPGDTFTCAGLDWKVEKKHWWD